MSKLRVVAKDADVEIKEFPFGGMILNRASGLKDQRYINVIFEKVENPAAGTSRAYVIKRPGLLNYSQPSGGSATGRGIYHWPGTGKIYSVFNNKIWSDTTDLGVTLTGSSGRVWFDESPQTFGAGYRLFVSDGVKLYDINTSDTINVTDTTDDAQFPTPNLGPVIWFDSYLLFGKANGEIWNSTEDTFASYSSLDFLAAEMFGDDLECLVRQKDQIIALGKYGIEFFFDNANTVGSPLLRIDQNALHIGLTSKNSVATCGDSLCFVGKEKAQGYSVWMIENLTSCKKVSTEQIERILKAEVSSISSCTATMFRVSGHMLYILNLSEGNRTLVYDLTENFWVEWQSTLGNKFNCISATEKDGIIFLQDAINGRVYMFDPNTYQDSGSNFVVTLQTDNYMCERPDSKKCSTLEVEGDTTTGNLAVSYSDDDYANFSTPRNIDMSLVWKHLERLGSFIRRAWKFTYTDNFPLRLIKFTLHIK